MIKLTKEEADRLRGRRKGQVSFEACPMCGACSFMSCNEAMEDRVMVMEGTTICDRCQDVHRRAPELTEWVLAVIAWHDSRRREEQKEMID